MKKTITMPDVLECTMAQCAYNREQTCHARAITIGGPGDHRCDTLCAGMGHVHRRAGAGVGACKTVECVHNKDLECAAEHIRVRMVQGNADCMSFRSK